MTISKPERIRDMADPSNPLRRSINLDNVESRGSVEPSAFTQKEKGDSPDPPALGRGHGLAWGSGTVGSTGLDLDEYDELAKGRDQVDLSDSFSVTALEDSISGRDERSFGGLLSGPPEALTVVPGRLRDRDHNLRFQIVP